MFVRLKDRELRWVTQMYLLFSNAVTASGDPHWLKSRCIPLLVYGKRGYRFGGGEAVMEVPWRVDRGADWVGVVDAGKERVVAGFARWGEAVCDPMLFGSSGAALAAMTRGCTFLGADDDAARLDRVYDSLSPAPSGDAPRRDSPEFRQMSFA